MSQGIPSLKAETTYPTSKTLVNTNFRENVSASSHAAWNNFCDEGPPNRGTKFRCPWSDARAPPLAARRCQT